MKAIKTLQLAALATAATLTFSACAANEHSSAPAASDSKTAFSGELIGAGASSMGSAQEAWAAGFQTANPAVTVNYDPAGSGTGRETFQSGASVFAGSDRAFKIEEIAKGEFASCKAGADIVEFPAYISPIAIIFNLDGIKTLKLDADTIAKIFTREITRWNDPAITSQNPEAALPDSAINPVHRSDKSGTTQNFTDYLAAASSSWSAGAVEEWPTEFGGEGAQGTSGMVAAVSGGVGTIGYADASRAKELGSIEVKVGDSYVAYTPEAAAAIVDASPQETGRAASDLVLKLDRKTQKTGVYPIVLVSYIIACSEYAAGKDGALAKAYLEYIVSAEGQESAAAAAGNAPLSAAIRNQISQILAAIK